MRRPIIAGNWKMYKTPSQARELAAGVAAGLKPERAAECEVVLCPPAVDLAAVAEVLRGTPVRLGAQNLYPQDEGAFTGEVSAPMLKELGVSSVIVGHSERRQYFAETDEFVNLKVKSALKHGLQPILCVGESLAEREAGTTEDRIKTQLAGGLADLTPVDFASLVLAYEPIWAIGTGRTATPEQAQAVHRFIRAWLAGQFGAAAAEAMRIQYGGSVKPDNIRSLMDQPDIDGALVGGASLKADSFLAIVGF